MYIYQQNTKKNITLTSKIYLNLGWLLFSDVGQYNGENFRNCLCDFLDHFDFVKPDPLAALFGPKSKIFVNQLFGPL